MSEVRIALEAFAAGELDYGELQRQLNAALAGGVGVDEAVAELDAIRDSDGLSVGLYNVLRRAITRVSDDDDTSPFGSDVTEPDRRAADASREAKEGDSIPGEDPGVDDLPMMFTEPEALLEEDLPALDPVGPVRADAEKHTGDDGGAEVGAEEEDPVPLPSGRWLAQPGWETPEEPGEADSESGTEPDPPPREPVIDGDHGEEPEEEEAPLPEAGDVIGGRYVIQSILGRGGMGVVFRVRDRYRDAAGAEDADLALKLLKPELRNSEDAGRRLLGEALQGQSLTHPNLVRVVDFGEADDMPYVTMELLDGESLRSAITRRTPEGFAPPEATGIIRGIASGLAYLHRRGYVHSDLKPGNLFLCRDGQARLLDFGLTRRPGRAMEPVLDGTGLPARTPAYASPQVLGGEAPGARDDVFSLGCVAFEIVAGRHPFGRVPADEAMERKLRPGRIKGIAAHQRRAIRRALNFVPGRRFADADAFLAAMGMRDDASAGRLKGFLPGALAGALAGILLTLAVINPDGFLHRLLGQGSGTVGTVTSPAAPEPAPITTAPPGPDRTATPVETPGSVSAGGTFSPDGIPRDAPADEPAPAAPAASGPVGGEGETAPAVPLSEPPVPSAPSGSGPTAEEPEAEAPAPSTEAAPAPAAPAPAPPLQAGPGRLQLDASSYRVDESSAVLIVRVIRTGGSRGPVSLRWRTRPGSATADEDYIGSDWQRVQLRDGEVGTRLFVPLVNDGRAEPEEGFTIEIGDAQGGAELGPRTRAEVRIVDDD